MTIRSPKWIPRGVWALLLISAAIGSVRAEDAAADRAFVARLETAANAGDAAALTSLAAPGVRPDFAWATRSPGMFGAPPPWRVRLLVPPGSGATGGAYVTFSRYHVVESTSDHLYRLTATAQGPRLGDEVPITSTGGYRVRDHRMTVRFDVPNHHVYLTDRATVERDAGAPATAVLRLNSIYTVRSVRRNGEPVPYRQAGGFLAVQAAPGPRAAYDLVYDAAISGSHEDYVDQNEAALTSYWYPHTARLPATARVSVTVPRGWVGIAEGEPVGKTVGAGTVTSTWNNSLPVCFITVAAGAYSVTTRRVGPISVSAYLLHPSAQRAESAISTAGNAVNWYAAHFSKYPFSRYAVVESDSFPAALECYSFTLAGSRLIPMAVVHEAAHTWWGGIVPNTYTRTLWNESFAEYSDGLYGRMTGKAGMHEFNTRVMTHGMGTLASSISLMRAHDAMAPADAVVGYGKGSLVLENLERMLGTDRMLACMRRFIARHRPGEDDEWQGFIDAVKDVAGPEWEGYFGPWLTRTDLPEFRLMNVRTTPEGSGFVVTGVIAQAPPAFWAAVPIVVKTPKGDVRSQVLVKSDSVPFRVVAAAKPSEVVLDPDSKVLRKAGSTASPPTLMSLQTLSGPLLVVYATGGSPEENAAARTASTAGLRDVFPFARLTAKPDTAITEDALDKSDVLFVGRTTAFQLPEVWKARLPLRCSGTSIGWESRERQGSDLWALVVLPHPARPDGLFAQAASVTPEGMRSITRQGDLDSLKSAFIVRGATPVIADSTPASDPTAVHLN